MKDIECPYCGTEQDIDHDDGKGYSETERHQQQCSNCEKTFIFTTYISFSYTPHKAECLNGEAHEYYPTHTYPTEFTEMECHLCGDRRKPTKEEMDDLYLREENRRAHQPR